LRDTNLRYALRKYSHENVPVGVAEESGREMKLCNGGLDQQLLQAAEESLKGQSLPFRLQGGVSQTR
jgi:hypothetical protein